MRSWELGALGGEAPPGLVLRGGLPGTLERGAGRGVELAGVELAGVELAGTVDEGSEPTGFERGS